MIKLLLDNVSDIVTHKHNNNKINSLFYCIGNNPLANYDAAELERISNSFGKIFFYEWSVWLSYTVFVFHTWKT